MAERKLIAVFGASGQQGGSVARALVADGRYRVRVLSRNTNNPKLKQFMDKGAEVARADYDEPESLKRALTGAYGCFIVTDAFTQQLGAEHETTQGMNAVKASKACGVQHIVFSGSPNTKKLFNFEMVYMESKALVEDFLEDNKYPFTAVRFPNYFENFMEYYPPQKVGDNTYVLNIPMDDKQMRGLGVPDMGYLVLGILNNRDKYLGKRIMLVGDIMTIPQYADVFAKIFPNKTFSQGTLTLEELRKQGVLGSASADIFEIEARFYVDNTVGLTKEIYPGVQSFEAWLNDHKESFESLLK